MDLEGLESFISIAREKSISKAAQLLHVTQPTLSSRIRKLEEALGIKLLERNWEGVKLTQKGHYFLLHAIQLIRELDNTSAVLQQKASSQIAKALEEVTCRDRFNICLDTGLSNPLVHFIISALQQSGLDLKYKYMIRPSISIVDMLEHGVIDIGIFYINSLTPSLRSVQLYEEDWVLLYSPDILPESDNLPTIIERLKQEAFVLFENPVNVYFFLEEMFLNMLGEVPRRLQLVDNVELMAAVIANGQGYTIVPRSYIPDLPPDRQQMRVLQLDVHSGLPNAEIHMAYSEHTPFPLPLEQFARQIIEHRTR